MTPDMQIFQQKKIRWIEAVHKRKKTGKLMISGAFLVTTILKF